VTLLPRERKAGGGSRPTQQKGRIGAARRRRYIRDMPSAVDLSPILPHRNVRLDTLVRLRWLSIIGQTTAVLAVYLGLGFDLPIWSCLAAVLLSAWLNVALRLAFSTTQRLEPDRAAWLLAFDIAELAVLLFLTGGVQNPFAVLFLAPVLLSATALPPRYTLVLGGFAIVCATVLVFVHFPLPWNPNQPVEFDPIYKLGIWFAIVIGIGFIGAYAWQITEESRQLTDALAATELVLAREQHLSQLDGLAAAAAHELGTPLSTITVIAKELENAIPADAPHGEDVRLLREQARRCREILSKLTQLSSGGAPFDQMRMSALMEEVVAPYRNFGVDIEIATSRSQGEEPVGMRNPGILYGLGNLMDNAVDFAEGRVSVAAAWTPEVIEVSINDDGPGFAPDIIARIGEPYVTSRTDSGGDERTGLGLGFFIAKTLLERSGASLSFENQTPPGHGAVVTVRWNRREFERMPPAPAT
jgi:two-component system, sensor histidine kinase RegB